MTAQTSFMPARAKLQIASIDVPEMIVQAQYNPQELQIDKQIPWHQDRPRGGQGAGRPGDGGGAAGAGGGGAAGAGGGGGAAGASGGGGRPPRGARNQSQQSDIEFNSAPTRSMTIELFFDSYESGISIEPSVQLLEQLSSMRAPHSKDSSLRRPHHCVVAWGASPGGMRPFLCVIESLTTKYTMWDSLGTPLRATCTLRLKEAERML